MFEMKVYWLSFGFYGETPIIRLFDDKAFADSFLDSIRRSKAFDYVSEIKPMEVDK